MQPAWQCEVGASCGRPALTCCLLALSQSVSQSVMAEKVLETDFPLIAPPNPPLSVHPRLVGSREHGRNGSLKRAYSSEEVTPLHPSGGSDTSDYLSDSLAPPGYQTLPPDSASSHKTDTLSLPPFRPPTHR